VREYATTIGIYLNEIKNGPWSDYVHPSAAYGGSMEPCFWQGHFAPVDGAGMAVLREIAETPKELVPA
jgi:hypothetical protein